MPQITVTTLRFLKVCTLKINRDIWKKDGYSEVDFNTDVACVAIKSLPNRSDINDAPTSLKAENNVSFLSLNTDIFVAFTKCPHILQCAHDKKGKI